jgi:Arc/MetJ-type ribon-helix-helix transcriptional regulator
MTIHLPKDVESSINAAVHSGLFASPDDMVAEIVRDYFRQRRHEQPCQGDTAAAAPAAGAATPPGRKPLWERAAELRKGIPEDEWAKLPPDGAAQLDHYLYGSPKRPTS